MGIKYVDVFSRTSKDSGFRLSLEGEKPVIMVWKGTIGNAVHHQSNWTTMRALRDFLDEVLKTKA